MNASVRCLCLLILTTVCEAYLPVRFNENEKIENPENCTISTSNGGYVHFLTCPDLFMSMETYINRNDYDQVSMEYRSTVACTPQFLPYKYLPHTKSNRNSLVLDKCQPPEHGSFGDGWPQLEYLKFQNFGTIGPLKRENFSGLNKLWSLRLWTNSSDEMPGDIFNDLTKLKEIQMSVRYANKNMFKNLNELEKLDIHITSAESLSAFDTSEMKNLSSFKTLRLSANSFTRLTKKFFEGCRNVENIQMKSNKFDAIDADAFEPLTNLRDIDMSFNELTSLPEGLFSRNLKLEKVQILFSDNLTFLPAGFLSHLPELREVEINCKLTSIPSDFVRGSVNLELLNLKFNKLTSLPRDLLQNHRKLKKVKLQGNKIRRSDLFDNLPPSTEVSYN